MEPPEPERVLTKAELERKEIEQRKKQVAMAKVRVQLNILKTDLQEAIQNQACSLVVLSVIFFTFY